MSLVIDKGNYRRYYKFRGEADDRVDRFHKDWFDSKVCLDVGCNEGLVTLDIAKKYSPRSILGIDIDKILIENAQSKLKRLLFGETKQPIHSSSSFAFVPRSVAQKTTKTAQTKTQIGKEIFPHNVHFVCKTVNDLSTSVDGHYDTIVCLSVVKWIHLNEGDAGLVAFFHKIYHLLHSGGLFILEFQPWKSYLNNKSINEHIKANFNSIMLRPDDFERVLSEVGFVLEQNIGASVAEAKGFDRPIFVLRKRDLTSSSNETSMEVASLDVSNGSRQKHSRLEWEESNNNDLFTSGKKQRL